MRLQKILLGLSLFYSFSQIDCNADYGQMFENKSILITGGTGFIGRALVASILPYNPKKIVIYSRDEVKHHQVMQQFNDPRLVSVLGDVRDYTAVKKATRNIDIVIHAAALKRLDTIEYNICESIKTNIEGTSNIAHACFSNKVPKAIFISSDKACLPANAYGACKYVSEKIFTNYANGTGNTTFVVVRYGNVLESTGSVIPFFLSRLKQGLSIPLTDSRMTRFFITKEQAVELIFKALMFGEGGEIFVPKLPAFRIIDLIDVLQEILGVKACIELIGLRPGEKIHELMISSAEIPRTYRFHDMFVITSSLINVRSYVNSKIDAFVNPQELFEYSSGESLLGKEKLKELLSEYQFSI